MNKDDFKNIVMYDNFIKNIHKNRIEMYKNYKKSINDLDFKSNMKNDHKTLINKKNNVIKIILNDLQKKVKEDKYNNYYKKNNEKDINNLLEYLRITE